MNLFFFGNCQLKALHDAHAAYVQPLTQDKAAWAHSAVPLAPGDAAKIAQADVLVIQAANFQPKTDISQIETKARRLVVPVVGLPFLWPYCGTAHPDSARKYGKYHPFTAEHADSWLLRRAAAGVPEDDAIAEYLRLDIAKAAHLDRRAEMEFDLLRERERGTPYQAADFIAARFRTEKLFRTPYHLTVPMARYMALTFLKELGVPEQAYARTEARMLEDFYIRSELPVHPGVAAHFGLAWAGPATSYRFYTEDMLTAEAFYRRFLRCEAYPDVPAVAEAVSRNEPGSAARLDHLLTLLPESPWLQAAMAKVKLRAGEADAALAWARRAREGYPGLPFVHLQIAECLVALGRHAEATEAFRQEIARAPYTIRLHISLAQHQERCGAFADAAETLGRAIDIDPARTDLLAARTRLLMRAGQQTAPAS